MNIGEAAAASGLSAKMLRYYESIGLVRPATRTESGYRIYGPDDVHRLRFIRRARSLGFSMGETSDLLALWQDPRRASADVKSLAARQVERLDAKIAELAAMRDTLDHLVGCCHGDTRPDCPILADMAADEKPSAIPQAPRASLSPPAGRGRAARNAPTG